MSATCGRISARGLTKEFGSHRAVDGLDFDVRPGRVTGFLGPNGSGKSTTLRLVLGLQTPTAGWATVAGQPFSELAHPLRTVGASLEGEAFARTRTGRRHLMCWAGLAGASRARVDELLGRVGLEDAADRRVGGYSLGMKQRLSLATALLGDPEILILDEPANGLDPDGILWLRGLLRGLAEEGRTVLVSSHMLSEMQRIVDDVLLIRSGQLLFSGPMSEVVEDGADAPWSRADRHQDLEAAYFSLTGAAR